MIVFEVMNSPHTVEWAQKRANPPVRIRSFEINDLQRSGQSPSRLDNHSRCDCLIRLLVNQNKAAGNTIGLVAISDEGRRGAQRDAPDVVMIEYEIILNFVQGIDVYLVILYSS